MKDRRVDLVNYYDKKSDEDEEGDEPCEELPHPLPLI